MKTDLEKEIDELIKGYADNTLTQNQRRRLYELLVSSDGNLVYEVLSLQLNAFRETHDENDSADFVRIYKKLISEIEVLESKEKEEQLTKRKGFVKNLMFGVSSAAAVFLLAFFLGINHHKHQASAIATVNKPVTYTEVKAPLGARSEIKLPDGTEVILNAGSSISYSSNYNSLDREIALEGEGYFKVARNPDLPLCVDAGNIIIEATGTEFNVKAYSDENIIETMLVSGTVEISQRGNEKNKDVVLKLEPNQKAIYARQSDKLILEKIKEIEPLAVKPASTIIKDLLVSPKTNVEVEQEISWTKNKLIIKRENLESLCTKLGRKYNVSFVFRDDEIKKYRFTGVLLDETFEQIMDAIMLVAPIDYSLNGKSVYLFSKKDLNKGTKHIQ